MGHKGPKKFTAGPGGLKSGWQQPSPRWVFVPVAGPGGLCDPNSIMMIGQVGHKIVMMYLNSKGDVLRMAMINA